MMMMMIMMAVIFIMKSVCKRRQLVACVRVSGRRGRERETGRFFSKNKKFKNANLPDFFLILSTNLAKKKNESSFCSSTKSNGEAEEAPSPRGGGLSRRSCSGSDGRGRNRGRSGRPHADQRRRNAAIDISRRCGGNDDGRRRRRWCRRYREQAPAQARGCRRRHGRRSRYICCCCYNCRRGGARCCKAQEEAPPFERRRRWRRWRWRRS